MLNNVINRWRTGKGSVATVLGYASHSVDEIWIRSTLLLCARSGIKTALAYSSGELSAETISLYKNTGIDLHANIGRDFLQKCSAPVVLTASSGLPASWFSKKNCLWRIHMPHSIASLHMIYPYDAFDGYNVLFSVGPHHDREYKTLSGQRGLKHRHSYPCGYGKLDVLKEKYLKADQYKGDTPHILLAPSWGKNNILNIMGRELIGALLDKGYALTLRPHPLFFLENDPLLAEYHEAFSGRDGYFLESSLEMGEAIFSADILISDYSGTIQEFTALTGNPAVFVDVPLKVLNNNWEVLNLDPIEIASRNNLGPLAGANISSVMTAIEDVRNRQEYWRDKVQGFSSQYLHEGVCAERAVFYIQELLADYKEKGVSACH